MKNKGAILGLALLLLAFNGLYIPFVLTRHERLNSMVWDLSIAEQALWNTLHGRFMASTIEPGVTNYFGDHFEAILLFLLPLYFLFEDVRVLLIVQSLFLSAGAIPLYKIAQRELENPYSALGMAALYLSYPALGFINRFDFHALALCIPFLMGGFYCFMVRKYPLGYALFGLALLCKEEIGLTVFMSGLFFALWGKERRHGLFLSMIGLGYSLIVMFLIMPALRQGHISDTFDRYVHLGKTPPEIVKTILFSPWQALDLKGKYFSLKVEYLWKLLLPLGFIPLLSLRTLMICLPALGYSWLSLNPSQASIYFHYTSPMVPFLFISSIFGIRRTKTWCYRVFPGKGPFLCQGLWIGLMALIALSLYLDNPVLKRVGAPYYRVLGLEKRDNLKEFHEAVSLIPEDASLMADNHLGTHLSKRKELCTPFYFNCVREPDYILLDLWDLGWQGELYRNWPQIYFQTLSYLLEEEKSGQIFYDEQGPIANNYGVVYYKKGVLLLQKETKGIEALKAMALRDVRASLTRAMKAQDEGGAE